MLDFRIFTNNLIRRIKTNSANPPKFKTHIPQLWGKYNQPYKGISLVDGYFELGQNGRK